MNNVEWFPKNGPATVMDLEQLIMIRNRDELSVFLYGATAPLLAENTAKDDEIAMLKTRLQSQKEVEYAITNIASRLLDQVVSLRAENADLRARLAPHEPKPEPTMGEVLARSFR